MSDVDLVFGSSGGMGLKVSAFHNLVNYEDILIIPLVP
jgi:hypothetical protein